MPPAWAGTALTEPDGMSKPLLGALALRSTRTWASAASRRWCSKADNLTTRWADRTTARASRPRRTHRRPWGPRLTRAGSRSPGGQTKPAVAGPAIARLPAGQVHV